MFIAQQIISFQYMFFVRFDFFHFNNFKTKIRDKFEKKKSRNEIGEAR